MTEPIPLRPSGPHPAPEELYLARHAPGDPASERLLRHAAGCAQCSEELARQEAFDQPEPLPAAALDAAWHAWRNSGRVKPAQAPVLRRPSRWSPALALAAVLTACVLGLGIWIVQRNLQEADVERGGQETAVTWSPSGVLKAPPAEFSLPGPNDKPRRVKVFDAAQSYTWTSEPTVTGRVVFPPEEQRRLRPGVEYFWTVLGGPEEGTATPSFKIEK